MVSTIDTHPKAQSARNFALEFLEKTGTSLDMVFCPKRGIEMNALEQAINLEGNETIYNHMVSKYGIDFAVKVGGLV